jgi:hypothetical protein
MSPPSLPAAIVGDESLGNRGTDASTRSGNESYFAV